MSRSHGLAGEFGAHAWAAPSRTPLYYPDAVTLAPGADRAALVSRIDTVAPGASVKDSFADLDLTEEGTGRMIPLFVYRTVPGRHPRT